MTPKEKAKYLVDKYIDEGICFVGDYSMEKSCALIVVDELIKETGKKYWYDVKLEIEKL